MTSKTQSLFSAAVFAASLFTALSLSSCGGPKCPQPTYAAKATDEAYYALVDAEKRIVTDDAKAPKLDLADGAQISGSERLTFRWTSSLTSSVFPPPQVAPQREPEPWYRRWLLSQAHAHGAPVTGPIFWIKVALADSKACPVAGLTTETNWTPTTEDWAKIVEGGGKRTVTAISAYMSENRVAEGPFQSSQTRSFTVSP